MAPNCKEERQKIPRVSRLKPTAVDLAEGGLGDAGIPKRVPFAYKRRATPHRIEPEGRGGQEMKNFSLYLFALVLCAGLLPVVPRVLPVENRDDAEIVHVLRTATGEVEEVPLEDYVIGTLTAAGYPCGGEALKAVAVCVRSCARYCELHRPTHRDAAACDDPTCCAPFTLESFDEKAVEAAAETRGLTVTYEGEIVPATTFASGGEKTANAKAVYGTDNPCLRGVENTVEADEPPTATVRLTADALTELLGAPDGSKADELFLAKEPSGRVAEVTFGLGGNWRMDGEEAADRLGLPSCFFEAKTDGTQVIFQCDGEGDGVGLSRRGAEKLAEAGKNFQEILQFYFPGGEIKEND